ncbi:hypothetical protein HanRHA438_Chr08g0346661 [Helianthus annuus]|nr:hypothetical protein HanRHA438_Chr08g0346661 [Helianthus annuus]
MSLAERPTALKEEMSALRLDVGGGMLLLAAAWLAVLESRLPNLTPQVGPPSFIINTRLAFLLKP